MWNAVRAVLSVTGLAIAFGCETAADVALPEEDHHLEAIMEAYVSERFRFYPVESTLAGLPGNDERLGDYSREAMEARIAWLVDFRQKLMGVRLTELSQPAYLDAMWLTNLVKAELFEIEVRERWRLTASFYAEPMRLGLVALLVDGDLASRDGALVSRLRAIPAFLDVARQNLEPAHALWRADGQASLDACRRLLRDLPEMLEGRLSPARVAELAELSRVGTRAIQSFLVALPELQSGEPQRGYVMGEAELERFFLYGAMTDWPVDRIAVAAEAELAVVGSEMMELALRELPSEPLRNALARRAPGDPIESLVTSAEVRVVAFLRERDGAVPLDAAIPVRRVPVYFPGVEPVQLWRPRALEPARGAFLMVRDVPRPDATELELLTLRELGGRAHQYALQAGARSLLRRVFADETARAGWLELFERNALNDGYGSDDASLRIEHGRRTMIELLRLIGVLRIHAHDAPLADVAALFEERGLLAPAEARAEAARVAIEPSVSFAALGRLLLDELADDYFDRHPLASPRELEASFTSEGLLPVALARFRMID